MPSLPRGRSAGATHLLRCGSRHSRRRAASRVAPAHGGARLDASTGPAATTQATRRALGGGSEYGSGRASRTGRRLAARRSSAPRPGGCGRQADFAPSCTGSAYRTRGDLGMMAAPLSHVTLQPAMAASIRHRYATDDTAGDGSCRICGQRPSAAAGDLWHDREAGTSSVTRWGTSEGALIWWHTSLGDQPVVLRLRWAPLTVKTRGSVVVRHNGPA
jgi:hypothetical protein